MKLFLFANGHVGARLTAWLEEQDDELVGIAVHPESKAKCRDEILAAAGLPDEQVFSADKLRDADTLARIQALQPDLGLSLYFGYILRAPLLDLLPRGCLNLHPGLLPWNRGAHPNVWSIVDQTPAGVTLHMIDEAIDTGAIVAQRQTEIDPTDNAKTLYHKLEETAIALVQDVWPGLARDGWVAEPQPAKGTEHRVRDLVALDEIDLDAPTTARQLINQLRARTFPPYPGCYFTDGDRKIYIDLSLHDEPNA